MSLQKKTNIYSEIKLVVMTCSNGNQWEPQVNSHTCNGYGSIQEFVLEIKGINSTVGSAC